MQVEAKSNIARKCPRLLAEAPRAHSSRHSKCPGGDWAQGLPEANQQRELRRAADNAEGVDRGYT
eukprot:9395979-Pyramimonas_sp.AAC.1